MVKVLSTTLVKNLNQLPKIQAGPTIDYFGEQLTEFLFQLIQQETRPTKTITKDTITKLTKKREGGIVEIPHFHYGGFINLNRL